VNKEVSMETRDYVKYAKREFRDKVYQDEFSMYEDFEPLAGNNRCDDGRDEWYLIKDENAEDYVLIIIDYHLFEENEIEVKHFDTLLSACNYIRDELDRDFSLGDSETADAIVGILDAIFGDKE
jgi:hypothetical protein